MGCLVEVRPVPRRGSFLRVSLRQPMVLEDPAPRNQDAHQDPDHQRAVGREDGRQPLREEQQRRGLVRDADCSDDDSGG